MRLVCAASIGIVVGGVLVAEPLLDFVFGPGYGSAARVLQVLLPAAACFIISRHYRVLLIAFNHHAAWFQSLLTPACLYVVLLAVFIPFKGLLGAAYAYLILQGLTFIFSGILANRRVGRISLFPYLLKPLLFSAIMAAALLLTTDVHVLLRLSLGGFVYAGLLVVFRVVTREEIQMAGRALRPDRVNTNER